jgi:hypothetical protein
MATKVAIEVDVKTGGVSDEIISLRQELEKVKAAQEKLSDEMKAGFQSAEKGAKNVSQGMKGFDTSIKGVLKSLGLIAVAMEVFNFLKELLMKNQKVADTLAIAFKAIEVLFNRLFKAVEPLGDAIMAAFEDPQQALKDLWEAIKTNFLNRISGIAVAAEGVGKVIKAAFELDWDGVKKGMLQYGQALIQVSTGLDIEQQNAFVNGIVDAGKEAINTATKIETLRKEVKRAEAQQGLLMLQYQKEAEVQRQIRDDVSKTIEERQAANKRLGEILDEQSQEELKLANKRLELALLEQSINKDSVDAEIEVINARKEIADIEERITGQRSEQKTNENSLKLEGIAISKEHIKQLEEEAQAEADAAYKIAEAKANAKKVLDDYLAERKSLSREEMIQKEIDDALAAEEAKFQAAVQAAQEQGVLLEELDALELAREEERLRIENEIRAKYYQEDVDLQERIKNEIAKINKERTDDAEAQAEARRKADIDNAFMTLNALQSISGSLQQLGVENASFAKTLAVSEIAINAAIAVAAAIKNATSSSATVWDMIANIAVAVGTVTAAIASASQILNSAPIPGGTSSVTASVSAPTISPVSTNTTQLNNQQQAQLAPIQAFVVETEMTGSQNNINQIQSQATFGYG